MTKFILIIENLLMAMFENINNQINLAPKQGAIVLFSFSIFILAIFLKRRTKGSSQ